MPRTTATKRQPSSDVPRHDRPFVRPVDLQTLLNQSRSNINRIRKVPGCPQPNKLGLYSRAEILAFYATITPEDIARVRDAEEPHRPLKRARYGDAEQQATALRLNGKTGKAGTPPSTPSTASVKAKAKPKVETKAAAKAPTATRKGRALASVAA